MTQSTSDLKGGRPTVYLDNILVSGKNAEDHLENLRQLLQKLKTMDYAVVWINVSLPNPLWSIWDILFRPRAYPGKRKLTLFVKCHDLTIFQRLNHF